ncbi:uncharacterized protein K460DRAFT_284624 [Cucurbitaria berberidis CBS 394.84]|uniref:Uncharacterized protein n=1 Tax=Cucurbitaria berberidis CBS 394.84 TaxID=1168544 RepID=A0A9P4L8Z0_9PLEO|nr:uncharacterized protein K460DRAFT_284624 [Cucurbitaria berberidis CBS 394.84]KAF1845842.1 hypothetical protein K460DRAFT_284624 [Cucurbitaria berberidis CBS 394.84]
MYRRGDPRWNRTIQHITENIEHANESAQENIYGFTQRYINPCFSSITHCLNACTAPCFPAHNDRRRHRGRSRGRAELSFDFYDDWENDESDGLLGWGSDNLDRLIGGANNYGATAQPGRQRVMSYGQRNRDSRYDASRRKSNTMPRDAGPDPTIIPSSSYFGFLGRLPFNIGGKGLRYKPSAADLTEHPGAIRRSVEEEQPLIEDSDEDAQVGSENKGHRRQRSDTHTSGHTTDSLSSRGDIFPSEDELEDAVPLDDEFTISLERRTTGQWNDDHINNNKVRSSKSKRPSGSRVSSRTASSRNRSNEDKVLQRSASATIDEVLTLDELENEEEHLRLEEEAEVQRKRQGAQQLAVKRGLASEHQLQTSSRTSSARSPSPRPPPQMTTVQSSVSPIAPSIASETAVPFEAIPFPSFVDAQTMPDSSSFHVDDSDYSSLAPTPNRPLSLKNQPRDIPQDDADFVPARLPHFG